MAMQHIKACLLFFAFFLFFSCVKPSKERSLTMQDVFPKQKNTDSTFVFSLDTIKSFNKIVDVFCTNFNNRKEKFFIRTQNNDVNFEIDYMMLCDKALCGMMRFRNILFIEHLSDTTFIHSNEKHTFNSRCFGKVLKKQFLNNGRNSNYAMSPQKNIVYLNFTSEKNMCDYGFERKLDTISKSYFNFLKSFKKQNIDSLRKVYPLNIRLNEFVPITIINDGEPQEETILEPEDSNEPEIIEIK